MGCLDIYWIRGHNSEENACTSTEMLNLKPIVVIFDRQKWLIVNCTSHSDKHPMMYFIVYWLQLHADLSVWAVGLHLLFLQSLAVLRIYLSSCVRAFACVHSGGGQPCKCIYTRNMHCGCPGQDVQAYSAF